MEWVNDGAKEDKSLPRKLVLYFSPDEAPLFRIKSVADKSLDLLFGIPVLAAFTLMFLIMGVVFGVPSLLYWIIPVLILGSLCIWKNPLFKSQQLLVLTNNRVYLYLKRHSYENIDSAKFSDLKAVIYRKRRVLERGEDVGTIDFISQEHKTAKFSINNVPELKKCQRIIESILYQYGGFKDRWDKIKLNMNFEFPYTCEVSEKGLDRISRRDGRLNIYIGIIWGMTLLVALVFYLYFTILGVIGQIIISGLIIFMGGIISIPFLSEKYVLRKRSSAPTDTLTLDSQRISCLTRKGPMTIRNTPQMCLNVNKITKMMGGFTTGREEPKFMQIKWFEDDLAFEIKPSPESDVGIQFGPVDAFPDIYELLFCYIINWKGEQNHLLSKEQIFRLEKQEIDKIAVEIKKDFATKTSAIIPSADLTEAPVEKHEYLYSYLHEVLESDEEILVAYTPKMNLTRRMIYIEIAVIGLVIGLLLSMFKPFEFIPGFGIDMMVIMMSVFCLVFNFLEFLGENNLKNSLFTFTNQQLIIKYANSYTFVDYDNIAAILRKDKKKIYNIELSLRTPIKTIPFTVRCLMALKYNIMHKPTILLPEVPRDNNLIDQINFIRENLL
ncbi:MAG: hypothetical protein HWN65_09260 [Candidatus Helarchaeota archaeon]|nr:hypothetical protein [Candidatus Helarchaeota archaeon]